LIKRRERREEKIYLDIGKMGRGKSRLFNSSRDQWLLEKPQIQIIT
jgi:hypothetical protein